MKRLTMLLLLLLFLSSTAFAYESLLIPDNLLMYESAPGGTVRITGYSGVTSILNTDEAAAVLDANNGKLVVRIPDTLGGRTVSAIGEYAFSGKTREAGFVLPATVTSIDEEAFSGCSALLEMDLSNVTSIHEKAFMNCRALTSVVFSDDLTEISAYAFMATGLQTVTIPASVKEIGEQAFSFSALEQVTILPGSELKIGDSAFSACDHLESITLPDHITKIGGDAFEDCDALQVILHPGSEAEYYCVTSRIQYGYGNDDLTEVAEMPTATPAPTAPPVQYQMVRDAAGNATLAPIATPVPYAPAPELEDPVYLPEPEAVDLASGQKPAIYSAPSKKALRTQKSKAVCKTDKDVSVFGEVNGWLMVLCQTDNGADRVGYVEKGGFKERVTTEALSFSNKTASLTRNTSLYEAFDKDSEKLADLKAGTEANYLGTYGSWAYIETTVDKKTARGFVPRNAIAIPGSGSKVKVKSATTSSSIPNYPITAAVNGKIDDSWQFKNPGNNLSKITAEFVFDSAKDLEYMIIWNGFWRVTNGNDQYSRNGRLEKVEISFRYDGTNSFTDAITVTIPEMKDWKTRRYGASINLQGHDKVIAVRIRPLSVRSGSKFKNDICVSELSFYSR